MATKRYHVSCKDWSDYLNRLGRLRSDSLDRIDLGKVYHFRGAAPVAPIWYIGNGFMDQFFLPDQEYMEAYLVRDDYPEYAFIKKQFKWVREQLHKACKERGINRMKAEYLDKPHI